MVAFGVLNPASRSRGVTDDAGLQLLADDTFSSKMKTLFDGHPTGTIEFLSLSDAVLRIHMLERRIEELDKRLTKLKYED